MIEQFGPGEAELSAIEAEWPVIAAEREIVGAECELAADPLNIFAARRFRRAVRARDIAVAEYSRTTCLPLVPVDPRSVA